jgi:hypothetical protein
VPTTGGPVFDRPVEPGEVDGPTRQRSLSRTRMVSAVTVIRCNAPSPVDAGPFGIDM